MKKFLVFLCVALLAMAFLAVPAFAGGLPAAHGVDGATFGGLVSDLAQTDPDALVDHILSVVRR